MKKRTQMSTWYTHNREKERPRPYSDGQIGSLLVYLFFRKVNKNFATGQPDPPRSEQWTAAEPNVVGRPAKWEFASIITHRLAVVSRRGSRRTNQPTKRPSASDPGCIRETEWDCLMTDFPWNSDRNWSFIDYQRLYLRVPIHLSCKIFIRVI